MTHSEPFAPSPPVSLTMLSKVPAILGDQVRGGSVYMLDNIPWPGAPSDDDDGSCANG